MLFLSKASLNRLRLYTDKNYRYDIIDHVVFSRTSVITSNLAGSYVMIYKGNGWVNLRISRWMVGHRFGEFTWNRKNFTKKK